MKPPDLTFACELATDDLTALFADPTILRSLVALGARVSLGLLDLSAERAHVAAALADAGVPVVAWLLLPPNEGYWFNADNGPHAVRRYAEFRDWSAAHNLVWDGVAIDIEPDLRLTQALARGALLHALIAMRRRGIDRSRAPRAEAIYSTLVTQMQIDGYRVDSYQLPLIVDERQAFSTVLRRLLGIVDVPVDREILMLYSSFLRWAGSGFLWSYARDADGIGIGSTGGGVDLDAPPSLQWAEFARDLRLARRWKDDIFVFSLEGCVAQGYLRRLLGFDWEGPIRAPVDGARKVRRARHLLQVGLWLGSRPGLIIAGFALLLGLGRWPARRRRRRLEA